MTRANAALVAAACCLLAVAGCGGGSQPAAQPVVSTPVGVTPSPTVVSTSASPETAEEFIRRWIQTGDSMQVTGDTESYRSLGRDCEACTTFADRIAAIYQAGGDIQFTGQRVTRMQQIKSVPGTTVLRVTTSSGPTSYATSATSDPQEYPGGRGTLEVTLAPTDSGWVVTEYYRVAQ